MSGWRAPRRVIQSRSFTPTALDICFVMFARLPALRLRRYHWWVCQWGDVGTFKGSEKASRMEVLGQVSPVFKWGLLKTVLKKASYEHNEWHLQDSMRTPLQICYICILNPSSHTHTIIYIYIYIIHVVLVMLCLTCLFRRFIICNRLALWGMGGLGEVWEKWGSKPPKQTPQWPQTKGSKKKCHWCRERKQK